MFAIPDSKSRNAAALSTTQVESRLAQASVNSGLWAVISSLATRVLNFVSVVVISHILGPEPIGELAAVMAVSGILLLLSDFGLSAATVQRKDITDEQVNGLFWTNVAGGTLVTLLLALLSPGMVWYYKNANLLGLGLLLSTTGLLAGLTVQHQSLLIRLMRFRTLAYINFAGRATASVFAIVAALLGAGVWALAWSTVIETTLIMVMVWWACPWRPGRPQLGRGTGELLSFGWRVAANSFVISVSRNADNILIGRFCGVVPLGLYSRAYSLLLLPFQQIVFPLANVAVPVLSRLQSEPVRYRQYFTKALRIMAMLSFPAVVIMIVMSDNIVRTVLGKEWLGAARIFSALGFAALVQPCMDTARWLQISLGRSQRLLRYGLIWSGAACLSFVIGLPFDAMGVAIAYAVCTLIFFVPLFWYAAHESPVRLTDVFASIWRPLAAAGIAAGALLVYRHYTPGVDADLLARLLTLTGACGLTAVVFSAAVCLLAGGWQPIRELWDLVQRARQKGGNE